MNAFRNSPALLAVAICVAVVGCGSKGPQILGKWYSFADDKLPTSDTFKAMEGPVAMLELKPDKKFTLEVIMAERPWPGTYSVDGNKINLVMDKTPEMGSPLPMAMGVLELKDGVLTATSGPISQMKVTFHRMADAWEKSWADQSSKDGALEQARFLSKALFMYGSDYNDVLPKGQPQLEKAITPYLRDGNDLSGFVYTFKGGKLPPENERKDLVLGTVVNHFGVVEIMADGAVHWQK